MTKVSPATFIVHSLQLNLVGRLRTIIALSRKTSFISKGFSYKLLSCELQNLSCDCNLQASHSRNSTWGSPDAWGRCGCCPALARPCTPAPGSWTCCLADGARVTTHGKMMPPLRRGVASSILRMRELRRGLGAVSPNAGEVLEVGCVRASPVYSMDIDQTDFLLEF